MNSGAYSLKGFIRFEAPGMFRGLFVTDHADDYSWCSAELTELGVNYASAGVLDFNAKQRDLRWCPFFNPKSSSISVAALAVAQGSLKLADSSR